jgi:transposase-like protein
MQSSTQFKPGERRGEVVVPGNGGERSEPEWTGTTTSENPFPPPDPEVLATPVRRKFTKEYRMAIIEEADRCKKPGDIGALLRREGLYSSYLRAWRLERKKNALLMMHTKKRGPTPTKDARDEQIARLERENKRLHKKLYQAETIIEIQKKLSLILGIPLPENDAIDS